VKSLIKNKKKADKPNLMRERIPASILLKWKTKREHGSVERIFHATKLSRGTISNAFKGLATSATVEIINDYFKSVK
jgi:hypothetical protein